MGTRRALFKVFVYLHTYLGLIFFFSFTSPYRYRKTLLRNLFNTFSQQNPKSRKIHCYICFLA